MFICSGESHVEKLGTKIHSGSTQNKIKVVDGTKLCFIDSIYFVWTENSATQNKVRLSTLSFSFHFWEGL